MNVYDYVISKSMSLVEIMKRLDETTRGIVYVCDDNGELCGSISDGDIRRSIIRSGRLDTNAVDVMNERPFYIQEYEEKSAEDVMKKNVIRSIPIVDKDRRIIDIKFIDDYISIESEKNKIDVPVVIMAGGKGARLQPYTDILPKPLIPIGEKTITEHIIERFENAGCSRFSMIVNYKKHIIKAYFRDNDIKRDIDFLDEEEFLGTAGGLRLLIGKYNDSFFVSNCDILIKADYSDIYNYHKKSGNIATVVCAVKNMTLPYGIILAKDSGRITEIKEKPDISSIVNTGLYVLEPEFLERIPEGQEVPITDVFQSCINDGLRVGMYPVSEDSWLDMGQFDELKKMTERIGEFE